jgi:hypothetical protein
VNGDQWTCKQEGRPDVDPAFIYACASPGTGDGRPAVLFQVRVRPLPPGVPDPG